MNEEKRQADGLTIHRFMQESSAPVVYLHGQPSEAEALAGHGWTVISVEDIDWNDDLTPWPSPAVFRGGRDFGGSAEQHLRRLIERIFPIAEENLHPSRRFIMGYSLAGMFALYAALTADCFDGAASVSGSMWYPNFLTFMEKSEALPEMAYFSVGDREKFGKNPAFRAIETDTLRAEEILKNRGVRTAFERNRGGHFEQSPQRMLRAFQWLKDNEESK